MRMLMDEVSVAARKEERKVSIVNGVDFDGQDVLIKYAVDHFELYTEVGILIATSRRAWVLNKFALDMGAREVKHGYDCSKHGDE